MLTRILEPETMDGAQTALDYDAMNHAGANDAFVADLLRCAPELANRDAAALDLGTGTALIPIALAMRTRALRITALDMSEAMLEQARRNIKAAGVEGKVHVALADAKRPLTQGYHAVISNSVVHHVAEPETLLATGLAATQPGGVLFVRDLLRPAAQADLDHLVEQYATPPAELRGGLLASALRQRELFAASLHAALTLSEVRGFVEAIGIDASSVNQTSDRHWTLAHRTAG
jgi:2-polyprenyl-3-methyl-5-hydroxy-6-metoxy-1,4-benzoquinol methylase